MNRLDLKFKQLKKSRRKAFIAYITAGDPALSVTPKIVGELERSGVDIVELGIPFSDPLADGPVIQAASKRALDRGATLKKIFGMARNLRLKTDIPLVFMTYYNPVLHYGLAKFFNDCRSCGVDGVIVPDLPCEEAGELVRHGKRSKVATIFLAAPTSTRKCLKEIIKRSTGFIYYVSLTGVTGSRRDLPAQLTANVRALKSMTKKPVCVGFGVSNPGQARIVARMADGVIVGSAIVKVIGEAGRAGTMIPAVSKLSRSLANAVHKV